MAAGMRWVLDGVWEEVGGGVSFGISASDRC